MYLVITIQLIVSDAQITNNTPIVRIFQAGQVL